MDARGIRVSFGGWPVLRGIDFAADDGEAVTLVGPNGAGKTTLLRVLAGLVRPEEGSVTFALRDHTRSRIAPRASIGMVGHQSMLYPELTAGENLALYARLYRVSRENQRITEVLGLVGLHDRRDHRASTLSRGMVQRLALARAVLHNPTILFLDEPDAGLDSDGIEMLRILVDTVGREQSSARTLVLATHDLGLALQLTRRMVVMSGGRVVDDFGLRDMDLAAIRNRYAMALGGARPELSACHG